MEPHFLHTKQHSEHSGIPTRGQSLHGRAGRSWIWWPLVTEPEQVAFFINRSRTIQCNCESVHAYPVRARCISNNMF
eukprot:747551-Rhodomonas_salina.1